MYLIPIARSSPATSAYRVASHAPTRPAPIPASTPYPIADGSIDDGQAIGIQT